MNTVSKSGLGRIFYYVPRRENGLIENDVMDFSGGESPVPSGRIIMQLPDQPPSRETAEEIRGKRCARRVTFRQIRDAYGDRAGEVIDDAADDAEIRGLLVKTFSW